LYVEGGLPFYEEPNEGGWKKKFHSSEGNKKTIGCQICMLVAPRAFPTVFV
jgi:hypothetical protein